MGQLILIASGKGGTGKSTFAVNCGAALARLGRKVLLIDADAGLRALDLMLGASDRVIYDLNDVLAGVCEPVRAILSTREPGLFLLPAPQSVSSEYLDGNEFKRLCRGLSRYYDYLFIDSPAGVGPGAQIAAAACERAMVVSTIDPVCVRDADKVAGMLLGLQVTDIRLVLNRVNSRLIRTGHVPNLDAAIDGAALQLIGVVPEDEGIMIAACEERPLFPNEKGAARAFANIALRLEGRDIPLMKL